MEGTIKSLWATVKKQLTGKNKQKLVLVLGICGMLLIFFSELAQPEHPNAKQTSKGQGEETPISNELYIEHMEQRLTALAESINGCGKCKVMVTLLQGTEYVYASEEKNTTDHSQNTEGEEVKRTEQKSNTESRIVVLQQNGGNHALVETRIEPEIKGVVIVCEGGNSAAVKERITEAVTTVLGIRTNQVCVVPKE